MIRSPLLLLTFFLIFGFFFPKSATAQDIDPQDVRRAIDQGIQYLKGRQQPNGNWNEFSGERVGPTALVVLALISCGVAKDDPALDRAMNYLRLFRGRDAGQNYAVSLQTMAFCLVDPDRDRPLIRANVEYLEKTQSRGGNAHDGGWNYTFLPTQNRTDLSNSQFSILALYEAERIGVSAKRDTWQRAFRYWDKTQNPNGSWDYTPAPDGGCTSKEGRGSMTCAGIASLVIGSGVIESGGATVRGENIFCAQKTSHRTAKKIQDGLDWLAKNFSVSQNPRFGMYYYYYLYALERVGRTTNHRFIGGRDWYRQGTDKLLHLRDPIDGAWRGNVGLGENDIVATSFALLFLSKGRRPVLMSKVQFGADDTWNIHPNDVNNMTSFAESRWKTDLTWQTIDISAATIDHLAQTPVLYLCGSRTPLPRNDKETGELATKLREYIDLGGFLFAESQPDDKNFDTGFRELMKQVFPEPGYELALLESSHPIWSAEIPIDPDQLRPIEGINFGCRTSVVYLPPYKRDNRPMPSLSCLWEVAKILQRDDPYPETVQRQIDAGLGIGLNILAYATNRELKYKEEITEKVFRSTTVSPLRRGKVFLGVLDHSGGANAAPRATVNLLQWTESNLGIPVELRGDLVDLSTVELYEYPILFMHGRNGFHFSEMQRQKLKKHLESGGFLFANAICSTKIFSDAFRAEMEKIFPDNPLQSIPPDDPLFSAEYGGNKIESLAMRIPEQSPGRRMIVPTRNVAPELYGIRHEDRWIAVFSPNDVSCALESANSIECRGYTPPAAMQLAVNVLLYSLKHW